MARPIYPAIIAACVLCCTAPAEADPVVTTCEIDARDYFSRIQIDGDTMWYLNGYSDKALLMHRDLVTGETVQCDVDHTVADTWLAKITLAPNGTLHVFASEVGETSLVNPRIITLPPEGPSTVSQTLALEKESPVDMCVDREGTLWLVLGHNGGIASIRDGELTRFLPTATFKGSIRSLVFDTTGTLWVGLQEGLFSYSGTNWERAQSDGEAITGITCATIDHSGGSWFGSSRGLWHYDGRDWTLFTTKDGLPTTRVSALAVDGTDTVWIGTKDGLAAYDGVDWRTFTTDNGLIGNEVTGLAANGAGVWCAAGEAKNGIARWDGASWTWHTIWNSTIPTNEVYDVVAACGAIWCRSDKGLLCHDGVTWRVEPLPVQIPATAITGLSSDNDARLCVFFDDTQETPGAIYDGQSWTVIVAPDGVGGETFNTFTSGGAGVLWFGTKGGVYALDGTTWSKYPEDVHILPDKGFCITMDDDGVLWFGMEGALVRFDGMNWDLITPNDRAYTFMDIHPRSDGTLWCVSYGSPGIYDPADNSYTPMPVYMDGILIQTPWCMDDADGTAWAGISSSFRLPGHEYYAGYYRDELPLFRLDGDTWEAVDFPLSKPCAVYSAPERDDDGTFWFGTSSGLIRFDGTTAGVLLGDDPRFEAYLATVDGDNVKWFLTDYTLDRFDGTEWTSYYLPEDSASGQVTASTPLDQIEWDGEDRLWLKRGDYLYSFNGNGVTRWDEALWGEALGLDYSRLDSNFCLDGNGDLWTAIYESLILIAGENVRAIPTNTVILWDTRLAIDSHDDLWVYASSGLSRGMNRFDGAEWVNFDADNGFYQAFGINNEYIQDVKADMVYFQEDAAGVLWCACFSYQPIPPPYPDGAYENEPSTFTHFHYGEFDLFRFEDETCTPIDLPATTYSLRLVTDGDGVAWAATTQGMVRLDGDELSLIPWPDGGLKAIFSLHAEAYGGIIASVGDLAPDGSGITITREETFLFRDGVLTPLPVNGKVLAIDHNNLLWYCADGAYHSCDIRPDIWEGPRSGMALRQSFPNPFNAATTIEFDLYGLSRVDLAVYNILGQKVRTLVHDRLNAGTHRIVWDTRDDAGSQVAAGPYFYRLSRNGHEESGRMLFVK